MSKVISVRDGVDANARRVVEAAAGTVAAPAAGAGPRIGFALDGADYMSIWARFNGSMTQAVVRPYYWNRIHELWVPGQSITFDTSTLSLIAIIQVQGEHKVTFAIEGVTGAGSVDLWAGKSNTGDVEEH
jgi:hypothetical protein